MKILVTGGMGYIGSHTIVELISAGHSIVAIDNHINSHKEVYDRLVKLTSVKFPLYNFDIGDKKALQQLFSEHKFDLVIHFAGLKAVNQSISMPVEYYENNIGKFLVLLEVMKEHAMKNIIFSSSATVYGAADTMPVNESMPYKPCTNPYGWTKQISEQILKDIYTADNSWNIVLLRYFNPIGAHPSGIIGEETISKEPNGLMPYLTKVAMGVLPKLHIYGGDYPTKDGTPIRDFIHVVDLARSHVAAIEVLAQNSGLRVYNVGTGQPYSVMEVLNTFMDVNKVKINYEISDRRPGDLGICYADNSLIKEELNWQPIYDLEDMCKDEWRWIQSLSKV